MPIKKLLFCNSTDRINVYETLNVGSIPIRTTKFMQLFLKFHVIKIINF